MITYKVIDSAMWSYIENGDILTVDGREIYNGDKKLSYSITEEHCTPTSIPALGTIRVIQIDNHNMSDKDKFFLSAELRARGKI